MPLHAAYVLAGGAKIPDGEKLKRTTDGPTTRLYYEARDPQIDLPFYVEMRRLGYSMGIGYDPIWTDYQHTPEWYAQSILNRRFELGGGPVLADIERHDPKFVIALLKELIRKLPGVNIAWTCESMQGGWIDDVPELISLINSNTQLVVVPQFYSGNMAPFAADYAVRNLVSSGIHPQKIRGFYGLRDEHWNTLRVPSWWDGILYLERWSLLP